MAFVSLFSVFFLLLIWCVVSRWVFDLSGVLGIWHALFALYADDPKQPDPEINYFTNFNQLSTIFSTLNNKKSAGFDGIPNISLKRLPNKIKWYYTVLFNNALNNTYFPKKWKKAKLIAITKKNKDGSSPANLRPISLLPNISKVYEMIINNPRSSLLLKK